MREPGIGRVLVASLHQGIADLLPSRLEFYENWLNPLGLRDGTIGLAPLAAVLSFLRREGEPYRLITARAGEYAADWTFAALPVFERTLVRALPVRLRTQVTLRLARRLVRASHAGSRAIGCLRRGAGTLEIRGSVFCGVRQTTTDPLCGFYAAAIARMFALVDLDSSVRTSHCVGTGGPACRVMVTVHGVRPDGSAGGA